MELLDSTNLQQQNELDLAEEKILIALFGQKSIPQYASLVLQYFHINVNDYIKKFENYVRPFMKENGLVEGKSINRVLKAFAPNIAQFLQLPDEDFRLYDIASDAAVLLQKIFPAIKV